MDIFTSVNVQRLDQEEPETIIPDIEESVTDTRNDHPLWCSKTAVTEAEECILPHSAAETSKYQDGYDSYYNRFGTAPEEILPDRIGQYAGEVHVVKEEDDDSLVEIKAGEDYEIIPDDDEADTEFGAPKEVRFKSECTPGEANSNITNNFIVPPGLSTSKENNSEYVFPINISEQCRMITDIISMNSHTKERPKDDVADMKKEEEDDSLVEIKSGEDYVIIPNNDEANSEFDKESNSKHVFPPNISEQCRIITDSISMNTKQRSKEGAADIALESSVLFQPIFNSDINDKDLKEKQNFQGAIYFNEQHDISTGSHGPVVLGDGYVTLVDFQPNRLADVYAADKHPQYSVHYSGNISGCPTPGSNDNAHLVSERHDLQLCSFDSNYQSALTSSSPDKPDILHSLLSNPQFKRKRIPNILKKQSCSKTFDESVNNSLPSLDQDLNEKQGATATRKSSYVRLENIRKVTVPVNGKLEEWTVVVQYTSSEESSEEEEEEETNSNVPQIENVFTLQEKPKTIPKRKRGKKRDVMQPVLYCSVSANNSVISCPERSCNSTAFESMLYLRKHIEETHFKLICKICGLLFSFRNHSFVNHMEMKHGTESEKDLPVSCYLCSMEFSSSYFLQKHQYETHEDYEYRCTLCGMTFSREASLAQHRKEEHILIDASYKCDFCTEYYLTMSSCLEHIMMIHTHKYFSIICCDCRILFPNRYSYVRHCTCVHNMPSKRMTSRTPKNITPFKRKMRGGHVISNKYKSYICIPNRTEEELEMQIPPFSLSGSSEISTQTYEIPDGPEGDLCRLTQTLEMEMTPNSPTISPSESPKELKIIPENDNKIKNASLEMLEAELCRQAQELERQKIEKNQNCNRTFNCDTESTRTFNSEVNPCSESNVKTVEPYFNKEVGRSAVSFLVCEDEDLKSQINRGSINSVCHRIQPNVYVIEDSDDNDDQL